MELSYWALFVLATVVLSLAMWPPILLSRKPPVSMMAWLLGVTLVPWLGPLVYLLGGRDRIRRGLPRRKRRSDRKIRGHLEPFLEREPLSDAVLAAVRRTLWPLMRLQERVGELPPTRGNRITPLPGAAPMYEHLFEDIRAATGQVHLEYYIFRADQIGWRLGRLLAEKARAGVAVRLLLDALGSFSLDSGFLEYLEHYGVQVGWFHPLNPLRRRFSLNLRNHRKITVVDGRIGYLGGINIGDEYLGQDPDIGEWEDLSVRLEGPVVAALQRIFLEDWRFAEKELLNQEACFPPLEPVNDDTEGLVQVISSGPDEDLDNLRRVYFAALSVARHQAWLMTPYFLPDESFRAAMESAALRGVDARVVMPERSDNWMVDLASRAPVRDVLESGVRVFRHRPGMLHAKCLLIDHIWAVIGTANMDVRSFRLNFEVGALLYDRTMARALERFFRHRFRHAQEVAYEDVTPVPRLRRAGENLVRLLSPLL